MKRPLVAVVSCYAAGLLFAEIFKPPIVALFAAAFILLALALVREKLRPFLTWPLLVLAGWTKLTVRTAVISPDDRRTLIGNEPAIITVRGILTETPKLKISESNGEQSGHSLAQVQASELRRDENWRPAFAEMVVTTPGVVPENFFAGQPVEISGVIARPPPPLADELFDYRNYGNPAGVWKQWMAGNLIPLLCQSD
jgi:Domain of unknown function (DUF4131)